MLKRKYFNGSSIDTTKWVNIGTGAVSITSGIAEFAALGRISTQGKVNFSGSKIVIEARLAIDKLRHWLAQQGVEFQMGQAVQEVISGAVLSGGQWLQADRIVVCPGPDIRSLFPEAFGQNNTQLCQLQMLRVQPPDGYKLGAGVMSDLSLVRYRGYSELPGAQLLHDQLRVECREALDHHCGGHGLRTRQVVRVRRRRVAAGWLMPSPAHRSPGLANGLLSPAPRAARPGQAAPRS